MKLVWAFALCSIILLSASCASRKEGWLQSDKKIELSAKELKSLKAQTNSHWQKRYDTKELLAALEGYEKLSRSTDDNYQYLAMLSRGYYFLADGHYDDIDQKMKYWEVGASWGEKAMATNPAFAKSIKAGASVGDSVKYLDKKQIDAVYWSAVNLGKWAKAEGLATILKFKSQVKEMVQFVENTDPEFYAGAAHRYWAVYYAVAPSFAGGDVKKSKTYFDKVLKKYPNYLANFVLYANFYLPKKDDQKEFDKVLNKVVSTKPKNDEFYPENLIEIKKAKALLKNKEDLF